jgi:hypothetical protein
MRTAFAALVLFGFVALTGAQPPKDPPPKDPKKDPEPKAPAKDPEPDYVAPKAPEPRYGVKPRLKQYPQDSPKVVLKAALAALDAGDYQYLVAQLLDPKFVDDGVTERAKLFEPGVLAELAQLRDFQRANPAKFTPDERIPLDAQGFATLVANTARDRAFKVLLRDVQQRLTDDPQSVREMRRMLRDGSFADADPAASVTHPDVKGRALYFRKVGDRWFLENRQAEEPKKEP